MELLPIGAAARRLGVNTSALRYYEERGLVSPVRRAGRRLYAPGDLRRLIFVQVLQRLGVGLDAAAAILDRPSDQWRGVVRDQLAALDELVARATAASTFLRHALECPAEHPVQECPFLGQTLDELVSAHSSSGQSTGR
jgi:DNA-binding transcriptional MerR regulator